MNKRIYVIIALLPALILLPGCAATIRPTDPVVTSSPVVDVRAQHYIDAVIKNWATCWPLIADDEPVLQFRDDQEAAREGYVDVVFIAETLTFSVGKWANGDDAIWPEGNTDARVDKAGCYDIG
jgi:hypothetical protein